MLNSQIISALSQAFSVFFRGTNFLRLVLGLLVTIRIAAISVALSLFFGTLMGILMTKKNRALRLVLKAYLEFMRIMPQMVLLFMAYYGLTRTFGISLSGDAASILVFTLWGTAEMGDLVRGALLSIPLHQYDSARSLSLTEGQIFRYVILPQTVQRLVPLSMNLITRMIKTTSLVVFVGVIEVVKIGQQIIEGNRLKVPSCSIAVYALIFAMYFVVCYAFSLLARAIEKHQRA